MSFNKISSLVQLYQLPLMGLASLTGFIFITKRFFFDGGRCYSKARLDGKTAIVTGANTGIGFVTAEDFAKRGARVILACRDKSRAEAAAASIRSSTGNGNVVVELVDLSSFNSIREFCQRVNKSEDKIDILVNNAGIMACPHWRTKEGFEMQFGTNHLGHFLLTNLLLGKIKSTKNSRIVNVSSRAYLRGEINWDDFNYDQGGYSPMKAYSQSKLCNILFTRELARRLKEENSTTTTYSLHPGVVRTELTRNLADSLGLKFTIVMFLIQPLFLWIAKSTVQGAQTQIHCSVDENVTKHSGEYFTDCAVKQLMPHALNDNDARRLWEISEKLVQLN